MNVELPQNIREELGDKLKPDLNAIKNMGIEITNEDLKKYINSQCNLTTCRYNQSGTCTNEDKRKECVEVSKKVLCLEDRENEFVSKKEE